MSGDGSERDVPIVCWGPSENLEYDTGKSKFHGKNLLID
jgi:hypothetical protein